jgi:hypothetical protein
MIPPIILIYKDDPNVYAVNKLDGLKRYDVKYLDELEGLIIIDVHGVLYLIERGDSKGWAYLFGYNPLYKGRYVNVFLVEKERRNLSLDDSKNIIINQLNKGIRTPYPYTSKQIPQIKRKVLESQSYQEVMNVFLYDLD